MLAVSVSDSAFRAEEASMAPSFLPPMPETAGQTAAEVDQKIIKTGSLSIVVDDVSSSVEEITTLAVGKGGFVQDSSVSERADGTKYGSIIVRVPSDEFENGVSEIKVLANLVENESTSGQDVTEQFTDLQAQLRNAQAQEQTYLSILSQATTVEDILNIQRELGYIRSQIESLQGRIQYLENQTSYSTISVFLKEEPSVLIPTREFRPLTEIREATRALVAIGQNLVLGLIWLAIIGGGILLPLGLLTWVIVATVKKLRKKSRQRK